MASLTSRARPLRLSAVAAISLMLAISAGIGLVRASHSDYTVVESTGTITPGTTEIGLADTDDEYVTISLPFPITFYGVEYTEAAVSSNGNVQFDVANADSDYDDGECLPEDDFGPTVFGYFGDLYLEGDPGYGVFSAVTGSAPSRQFILEWRGEYYDSNEPMNFEIVFYENSDTVTVIYGEATASPDTMMIGVQESFEGRLTQWDCGEPLQDVTGKRLDFVMPHGAFQFAQATQTVAESGTTATLTVDRVGGSEGEATVDYAATGGSATEGTDYVLAAGTLSFADGETSKTFDIAIVNDTIDESDETIQLTLSNPTGFTSLGSPSSSVVTITDDDAAAASPGGATPSATPTPAASLLPDTAGTAPSGTNVPTVPAAIGLGILVLVSLTALVERRRRA